MNRDDATTSHLPLPSHSRSVRSIIDEACDQFESLWRAGNPPSIEKFIAACDESARGLLLRELILVDIEYRQRRGETNLWDDYAARFPAHSELVRQLAMEGDSRVEMQSTLAASPSSDIPTQVASSAQFLDLRFHNRGGLGEIYVAQDETLRRHVALKFIQRRHQPDGEFRERFLLEAEITGRLDHPGVVPVYGVGETSDGRPFYAMRFIQGQTLREAIDAFHRVDWKARGRRSQRLELHALLAHLIGACNTIAYAHNRGIVHRDVKPENIMLGKYGETMLLDWGLALSFERDERARASGERTLMPSVASDNSSVTGAGTIGYMSPEQLPDSNDPVGPASDIYSLGATLYKLLTGKTPIHGQPGAALWDRIRRGDFPPPREINRDAPKAIEAICLKAMSARVSDRYDSALSMASDLQAWMADEPVGVYREPWIERLLRSARRHRNWTASIAVAVMAVLLIALLAGFALSRLARHEHDTRVAADKARDRSLLDSAEYASEALAAGIDRRWRILREVAEDPEFRKLVAATDGHAIGSESWRAVQMWLANRSITVVTAEDPVGSWSVVNSKGVQIARVPEDELTIGSNFAHRTYFHGLGHDRDPGTVTEPIRMAYLAHPFRSHAKDGLLRLTLSAPVWPPGLRHPDTKPVGVLAMSVFPGDLDALHQAILVDTRTDTIDGTLRRGVLLQHPRMGEAIGRKDAERVPIDQLEELELAVQSLRTPGWRSRSTKRDKSVLVQDFVDPLDPQHHPSLAAMAPVVIRTYRKDEDYDTGLIVIVTDQPSQSTSR